MRIVWIAALGVGGATVLGALLGFLLGRCRFIKEDAMLSLAGGVMLSAALVGLLLPALEAGAPLPWASLLLGVLCGGLCLQGLEATLPFLYRLAGLGGDHLHNARVSSALLLVAAIAVHNLPEGLAAGVSFGTGNIGDAITVAAGIALQNLPEGMAIIAPMLGAGISRRRTLLLAVATGLVEVLGTLLGYLAVSLCSTLLPFALSLAGGTMLFVVVHEMIPATHRNENEHGSTYAFLCGTCAMLILNLYL